MKHFTMTVENCSECPNAYVIGTEDNGGRYYKCKLIKKIVGVIDRAIYDEVKDEFNYKDDIPNDCPLTDTNW